jgi:hypothetical protein
LQIFKHRLPPEGILPLREARPTPFRRQKKPSNQEETPSRCGKKQREGVLTLPGYIRLRPSNLWLCTITIPLFWQNVTFQNRKSATVAMLSVMGSLLGYDASIHGRSRNSQALAVMEWGKGGYFRSGHLCSEPPPKNEALYGL